MYELKKLSRVYPKGRGKVVALNDVNLVIQDGEFLTIQGPTGSGKTTLLLILGALDKPTSGSIVFDGRNLASLPESQLVDVRARNCRSTSRLQNAGLAPWRHWPTSGCLTARATSPRNSPAGSSSG